MSARTKKRRQAGLSREKLIMLLLSVVLIVAATALSLHLNGSLTLDNLVVELGLKPPAAVLLENVPDYSGEPYVILQDNQPNFGLEDLTIEPFETYSELDYLGRCGAAYANICLDIMPTEPREEIGQVKPTGWQTVKYDCVDGKYLYNRCHLIGYQLAGENANKRNLITGTRYPPQEHERHRRSTGGADGGISGEAGAPDRLARCHVGREADHGGGGQGYDRGRHPQGETEGLCGQDCGCPDTPGIPGQTQPRTDRERGLKCTPPCEGVREVRKWQSRRRLRSRRREKSRWNSMCWSRRG